MDFEAPSASSPPAPARERHGGWLCACARVGSAQRRAPSAVRRPWLAQLCAQAIDALELPGCARLLVDSLETRPSRLEWDAALVGGPPQRLAVEEKPDEPDLRRGEAVSFPHRIPSCARSGVDQDDGAGGMQSESDATE